MKERKKGRKQVYFFSLFNIQIVIVIKEKGKTKKKK